MELNSNTYSNKMAGVKIQYVYDNFYDNFYDINNRHYHINSSLKHLLALFCWILIIFEQGMYLVLYLVHLKYRSYHCTYKRSLFV
jgi:hypothetical protein